MPTDLERRLEQARPEIPEPGAEARTRALETALGALPQRRAHWRRGRLVAAAVAVVLAALVVAPALGLTGSLLDLLPLGGEKKEEFLKARCKASTVHVDFDPAKGVAVTSGGETLGFAGFGTHEIDNGCEPLPVRQLAPAYSDAAYAELPEEGVYEATRLVCTVPGSFEISAHPIFFESVPGPITGSVLLLARGDPPSVLYSAVLKPGAGASRIYYVRGPCRKA